MSQLLEAARDLSAQELLHVLNEKLGVEFTRLQNHSPSIISAASLEAEIKSLETRAHDILRIVPSLRNLLQPVNRLPPEILSRIVQYFLYNKVATDTRLIVPLTHVCRYWRRSITSDPRNWAVVSNLSKDLTTLSLERVKMTPLEVSLVTRGGAVPCYLPIPYIKNIASLQVMNPTTIDTLRQALPDFPRSMPNLRSLEFGSYPGLYWDRSVDPFKSLASTIRRINLAHVPLYPSILRLKSLTELTYTNPQFDLSLATLLDLLEENPSLERMTLAICFKHPSLHSSRRRTPVENRLEYLSIRYQNATDGRALISNIALRRGAHLNLVNSAGGKGLNDVLSFVPAVSLSNLRSPTSIEYRSFVRDIQLFGTNGGFSLRGTSICDSGTPFMELPLLPLTKVREFRLMHRTPEEMSRTKVDPQVFPPSHFPALETLAVDCETSVSHLLSALFSSPSSLPSLNTLAFLNCNLDEDFMEELTQYASNRKETTSAWLHRVVIVNPDGVFPRIDSIRTLGGHVPVVDVRVGTELPKDLT